MSVRTKSFFDREPRKPRTGQWTRRPYDRDLVNRPPAPLPPPNLPIPATSQAKSKLKAYQFVPEEPKQPAEGASKEEHVAMVHSMTEDDQHAHGAESANSTGAHRTPSMPHANTFPSTPGARLPLKDLIGNCDEANVEEPAVKSPEEQLGWIPNSSSGTTPNKRKRKRAKSSSPSCPATSSQHACAPLGSVDYGATSSVKRTPAPDPVADLWLRYANGKPSGGTSEVSRISSLVFQGSPRPVETPVKSGPFRRWASTGNDWPTTKTKRRGLDQKHSIAVWQDQTAAASGGTSKVASMVQKMQQTLATQGLEQQQQQPDNAKPAVVTRDCPSSSSPLPEVGTESFPTPAVVSPLQGRQAHSRSPHKHATVPSKTNEPKDRPQSRGSREPLSGSGGGNIKPVGDPLNPGAGLRLHLQSKAPLPAYKRPSITRPPSQPQGPRAPPTTLPSRDFDEFGDDAFESIADDIDKLLSQRESSIQHRHPAQKQWAAERQAPLPASPKEIIKLDDDDEFDCGDIDEDSFVQAEFSATQLLRISPHKRKPRNQRHAPAAAYDRSCSETQESRSRPRFQRYVAQKVVDGEYTTEKKQRCQERVVLAEDQMTSNLVAITLRGSWAHTPVTKGDTVHVAYVSCVSDPAKRANEPPGQVMVDDEATSPFLLVHPDHMLSATTVADSFDCIRKAVLQDRIKATSESAKPLVYGKILHEVFQKALSTNQWDQAFLAELVERTVQAHIEGLWELGMRDTVLAIEEVKAKMGELGAWAHTFVAEQPSDQSLVDDRPGEKVWMTISKLIAIEEHIWSPQFGLKGNIDATVQTTFVDSPDKPAKRLIVPFEVKTGRTTQSPAHRAQTALYTLLLSDRYDVAVDAGILYYLESSSMSRVCPPLTELRQMVQQRNRLAAHIHSARHLSVETSERLTNRVEHRPMESQELEDSGLPSLLKNPFKCGKCYAQQSCFTYHALVEGGTAESAGMVDDQRKNHSLVWNEAVGHLMLSHTHSAQVDRLRRWFSRWDGLLTFEEGDQARFRKELWTMSSEERERLGRCFGRLVLSQDLSSTAKTSETQIQDDIEGSGGKINRFTYVFTRPDHAPGGSFAEGSQLTVGEPVVVSSEQNQWALANGYVVAATRQNITVAVDRKLGHARQRLAAFDAKSNHAFKGIMAVHKYDDILQEGAPMLYRLDKDEFSNGLALVRNNLVNLMSSHPVSAKLREQLIFSTEPCFQDPSPAVEQSRPTQAHEMNDDQQAAVSKVLRAQDYALILGMPGTGKTTTIAHIICALLAENKSILLTSFTHTAVDNILLKIRGIAPPGSILRLGVPAKINTQVQEFCRLAATPRRTIDEVDAAYMDSKIVATTCMGTNHALFQRRCFDVCIVDEASQITLPTILGPLLRARTFVLVGDHFQLPPLVQNKAALEGGLDVSLFRQLSEEQPAAVAALGRQYRMCQEVMMLSNELIYHGKLQCGSEAVARRTLQLRDVQALHRFHGPSAVHQHQCPDDSSCWIASTTNAERKVIFANTDQVGKSSTETLTTGKNITNQLEATISAQLVLSFVAMGVPASEIGIITLYRSQLALIRQLYKKAGIPPEVEIDSADRFQGRDKECIILSMVRSNEAGMVGDLLKDWRRVNVALTRARSKLVVLGSRRTLKNNELLAKFIALVDRERWAIDLPREADELHAFNFSTQLTQNLLAAASASSETPAKLRSPQKKQQSPVKANRPSPSSRVLQPSQNAGNRSSSKTDSSLKAAGSSGITKAPPKRINGKENAEMKATKRAAIAREQIAMEIFEDLTGEEF